MLISSFTESIPYLIKQEDHTTRKVNKASYKNLFLLRKTRAFYIRLKKKGKANKASYEINLPLFYSVRDKPCGSHLGALQ